MAGSRKYHYLFNPLKIGPIGVRDRLFFSPHANNFSMKAIQSINPDHCNGVTKRLH